MPHAPVDWCKQKTASLYTYQSTYVIRKRHIIAVLHISKPWKWKKNEKRGVGCEKGGCCVLSTSTCAIFRSNYFHLKMFFFYFLFKYSLNIC
jgi:hypothetical protein